MIFNNNLSHKSSFCRDIMKSVNTKPNSIHPTAGVDEFEIGKWKLVIINNSYGPYIILKGPRGQQLHFPPVVNPNIIIPASAIPKYIIKELPAIV